jgi:protein O-GlcNAc transferase
MTTNERFRRALQLQEAGHLAEAEKIYRELLADSPEYVDALVNLGTIYGATGRLPDAIEIWREAGRLAPSNWLIDMNLGIALAALRQFDDAIASYRRALLHAPEPAELFHMIALAQQGSGQLREARSSWDQAIDHDPLSAKYWFHRGLVCAEFGEFDQALESAERSLLVKPDYAEAMNLKGAVLRDLRRDAEAEECLRKAVELKPDYAPALNNYGLALVEAGFVEKAIAIFRRAVAGSPKSAANHSNLLLALNYSGRIGNSDVFAEHRRWAEANADSLAPAARLAPRQRGHGDRLRIGYVSADFRTHPASVFTTAFLPHHNRGEFHFFAYSSVQNEDETTARLKSMIETWRPILGRTDEQVANMIRDDGIDILVDLSGHTSGNRMLVFARQAAPVQASVYVYPNTSGLRTMQYRTTDDFLDPPGSSESPYTEKLIRLPEISWCYRPRDEAPAVAPLPAQRAGQITFGSLNNLAKVTDDVVALWARILNAVPSSRLLMAVSRSPVGRSRMELLLAKSGIKAGRIEMRSRMSLREYLTLFEQIDVALDPFPYNGVTTTCDTLWMGVPVVTLAGSSCRARQGVCLLSNVGLTQFIAKDIDEYVQIATSWANRIDELRDLRAGLRDRMRESPVVQGKVYAARLEAAFRQMWSDSGYE